MTVATETTDSTQTTPQVAVSTTAPDEEERRTLLDRLRGYAPWIGAVVLLLAFLSAMKWWGDQQQRAALQFAHPFPLLLIGTARHANDPSSYTLFCVVA